MVHCGKNNTAFCVKSAKLSSFSTMLRRFKDAEYLFCLENVLVVEIKNKLEICPLEDSYVFESTCINILLRGL